MKPRYCLITGTILLSGLFLQGPSALAGASDEAYTHTPEMITRVRVLTDDASPMVRQVLPDSESEWEKASQAAENAFKGGNYGEAQRQLIAAAKLAQKVVPADRRLALSAYNLGVLFQGRGQYAKAELCYERAVKELGKLKGSDDPEVMSGMSRLAQFYILEDKLAKADPIYTRLTSSIAKKLPEEQSARTSLNNLSGFYCRHLEYAHANELIKKLEDTTLKTLAIEHLELAVSMDNLASAYKAKGKYPAAEQLAKRSLEMRQLALPPEHMALAAGYGNLANLYLAQGKFGQAEPLLKQALEIQQKRNGVASEQLSQINDLAVCYMKQGKDQQADTMYQQVLPVIEKKSGAGLEYARAISQLAGIYKRQGRYDQAEPLIKRALSIYEGANGPQHSSLIPMLDSYAEILRLTNKSKEADRQIARARAIRGM